ncbi:hypothetical protein ABW365_10055 [Enterococcus avium]
MYAKGVAGGNFRLGYYILMKPTFVAERWFFCITVKADYAKKNILGFFSFKRNSSLMKEFILFKNSVFGT